MSEWVQHDGSGIPVPFGTVVIVRRKSGVVDGPFPAGAHPDNAKKGPIPFEKYNCWAWHTCPSFSDHHVVAYRIIDDGAEAKRRAARKAVFDNMAKEALQDGIRKAPEKERV